MLKLLWAIGGSTAGFVAQSGQHNYNTDNEESAELFRFRSRVLGIPAAAAMDAEEIAAYPRGVNQTQRLRRLATTDPNALVEAQRLISDTWNSMPGGGQGCCSDNCGVTDELWEAMSIGVIAMVLQTALKPGDSLRKAQEQAALNRVEAILDHYDETALSQQDASLLKAYIQAGDPTAPFLETSRPTAWQRDPLEIFSENYLLYKMAAKYAVMCTAPAVLFGLGDDPRLSCALRVLTGIEIETTLEAILLFLPEDRDVDALDPLIPHIPGGKKRKVQWLLDQPLPVVHRTDEAKTPASENQIAALFVAYADLGRIGRSDTATAIATDLDKKDLEALACEVWELWFKAGSQSKTKWVLPFVAVFGGATMTSKLIHAINDWPQNARGAIACDAVAALSVSPDPAALVTVDSISRKFKFRQVKAAATAALESAAKELGITTEELADRIVPSLDFAPDGTRIFDYGPRKFIVRLTPSLELAVNTDAGKAVKAMPAPGKTDDAEKAAAAYETYKALKKQIKTTVTAQRARLELALSAQRCWDTDAWRKLFVENPIMHQFAISLIWGVYENGELKETFRYMEDGSFNTADEEEYSLPDGANIGLVHPIELNEDTLNTWKQQLEDYEITQSIQQLSRPVFRLPAEQAQAPSLETAAGRILSALSLSGKLQSDL